MIRQVLKLFNRHHWVIINGSTRKCSICGKMQDRFRPNAPIKDEGTWHDTYPDKGPAGTRCYGD